MTDTVTRDYSPSNCSWIISPYTKKLVISGAAGKKVYLTHVNPTDEKLDHTNLRKAKLDSGGISASRAAFRQRALPVEDVFNSIVLNDEANGKLDGRARIERFFAERLKKPSNNSRSMLSASGPTSAGYNEGDKADIYVLNPDTDELDLRTLNYTLYHKGDIYSVWIYEDDECYTDSTKKTQFLNNLTLLVDNFIQGYKIVSHIYGEPADHLYKKDSSSKFRPSVPLSETSFGTSINIVIVPNLLEKHESYGYINGGDLIYNDECGNSVHF